jgi:hypothetical protein
MRQATGALGDCLPFLKVCWGYDCMYALGETYGCWADGLPGVYFYFYLADGSYTSHFADFWKFAYGSPKQPEPQPMNNVFLAPATRGIEHLTDQVVFQSADDIQNKASQGTKLIPYEEVRKKADPEVDSHGKYHSAVHASLTGHFPVVQDLLRPRIEGLFRAKPTGAKVIARVRQAVCKAKGHSHSKQKTP